MKKEIIIFSLILIFLFVTQITVFAQVKIDVEKQTADKGLLSGIASACYESGQCTLIDFMIVVSNIFRLLREIAFWAAVGFGIYGGINLIISQGNPSKIKSGRNIIMAAFVGLMIVFGVSLIINIALLALSKKPITIEYIWTPQEILFKK
ncbi:MAG: hypothetical protein ACPLKV_00530 [Minisyncoccia bacterium]